jgi:hypothetical protein
VLEGVDLTGAAIALSVLLAGVGLTIAWLPVVRVDGWTSLFPRLLACAGVAAVVLDDGFGLGAVLGLALGGLGGVAAWQSRPPADLPRPRRVGVLVAAALSGLLVLAADQGWWLFDRVPEVAAPWVALALGGVGALATLAVADRERVRYREALLRRVPPA